MKKWLIAVCCILVAVVVAFVTVQTRSSSQIDALNHDLGDMQEEYNALKEKSDQDEKTIADLNQQVTDLTNETARLTAENSELSNNLQGVNQRLSNSQEKLQGVMYILTDGAEGSIDSLVSPYVKIYNDVPLNSEYFDAVKYVTENGLMAPLGEDVFGLTEKASLGEFAYGLFVMQGKTGTAEEAVSALLQSEAAQLASQTPEEPEEEPAAEEPTEEPAEEPTEVPATEEPLTEEPTEETAEEPAAEEPAEEPAAEETAEEPTEETAEEPAAEEPTEEPAAEETAEEPAAEEPAEEPAAEEPAEVQAAEDASTILTRERFLALAGVYCQERGVSVPQMTFSGSETEELFRGDLAIALQKLATAE